MMNPNDFLNLMEEKEMDKTVRFGVVDSAYTTGRPKIKFDGMDAASVKTYPHLASYTPVANERVMVIKNVVIGRIV